MPVSKDNQDYGKKDQVNEQNEKNKSNEKMTGKESGLQDENNFTSDNQKGKKIDADLENDKDRPADV